jgi:hypothetical protein
MSAVAGPVLAASVLLAFAGLAKVRSPRSTVQAMRAAGLAAPPWAGRTLGLFELAAALWCLLSGSRFSCALVALAYLAFAAFSARLLRAADGSGSSCGCFGQAEAPASSVHIGLNLVLGLAAVLAVADPPGGPAHLFDRGVPEGVALAMFVALGAWASYLALTLLPELLLAARGAEVGTR